LQAVQYAAAAADDDVDDDDFCHLNFLSNASQYAVAAPLAQSHLQLACLLLEPRCCNPAWAVVGVGGDHTLQQQPRLCSSNIEMAAQCTQSTIPPLKVPQTHDQYQLF
jgi:hypothetical protein